MSEWEWSSEGNFLEFKDAQAAFRGKEFYEQLQRESFQAGLAAAAKHEPVTLLNGSAFLGLSCSACGWVYSCSGQSWAEHIKAVTE